MQGFLIFLPEHLHWQQRLPHVLPVSGVFDTPILNGAIYHQSTINDVLVEGLSVTAGLRLDYEKLKLDYNSVCDMNFDFSVSAPFPSNSDCQTTECQDTVHRKRIDRLPSTAPQIHYTVCMEQ